MSEWGVREAPRRAGGAARYAPAVRSSAALLAVSLVACGAAGGSRAGGSAGEPAELAGITAAHDAVRAGVGVGPLTWDPALAAIAAAWVAQCHSTGGEIVDHNPHRSDGYPTSVGENIYASTGDATAAGAVSSWAAEAAHYHHDTNTCDAAATCGHYTQVVWAATTKVGCAKHRCGGLAYPSTIVCDYAPAGNVVGQRPY